MMVAVDDCFRIVNRLSEFSISDTLARRLHVSIDQRTISLDGVRIVNEVVDIFDLDGFNSRAKDDSFISVVSA